jgi:hypothetical protein
MASPAIISRGTAYHFREELATGVHRTTSGAPGLPLTEAEITERMEALQARAESMSAGHRQRELAKLQELEKTVIARMEELKKKADDQHAEAMGQLGGLHTKIDGLSGGVQSMTAFAALIADGTVPPRKEGQTMKDRQLELQNAKRVVDCELALVRNLAEKETREEKLRQRTAGAAMQKELTGANMDSMSLDEATELVAGFKKMNRQIEKGFEADLRDLRKRRAEEAKGNAKKARTADDGEQAGPLGADSGHGGFSNR